MALNSERERRGPGNDNDNNKNNNNNNNCNNCLKTSPRHHKECRVDRIKSKCEGCRKSLKENCLKVRRKTILDNE